LTKHNPDINWIDNTLVFNRCPSACGMVPALLRRADVGHSLGLDLIDFPDDDGCDLESHLKRGDRIVSPQFHDFVDVFTKEDFENTPDSQIWDHAIELKAGSKP
ncbi:hypothetical protein JAAARDRAFT_85412, partial [Jaapia argillacea MUCL 33604]